MPTPAYHRWMTFLMEPRSGATRLSPSTPSIIAPLDDTGVAGLPPGEGLGALSVRRNAELPRGAGLPPAIVWLRSIVDNPVHLCDARRPPGGSPAPRGPLGGSPLTKCSAERPPGRSPTPQGQPGALSIVGGG